MPTTDDLKPLGFEMVSTQQLCRALGVCRMTVLRMIDRDPTFPQPIHLAGSNRKFFAKAAVLKWVADSTERGRVKARAPHSAEARV